MASIQTTLTSWRDIHTDTPITQINQWLKDVMERSTISCRVHPKLVAYYNVTNKQNYAVSRLEEDRINYEVCDTISRLPRNMIVTGSAGIVASDTQNIVEGS